MACHIGREYGESQKSRHIDKSRREAEQGSEPDIVFVSAIGSGMAKHSIKEIAMSKVSCFLRYDMVFINGRSCSFFSIQGLVGYFQPLTSLNIAMSHLFRKFASN
jgi:hypothetical protein